MALIQAIEHGKEHRKHYRDYLYRGGWFKSCVNHNPNRVQCPWCLGNRLHSQKVREEASAALLREYADGVPTHTSANE